MVIQDDSMWSIGFWGSFSTVHWRIGDRILIHKDSPSSSTNYMLINVDAKKNVSAGLIVWRYI